jgi:hypothetical protein
VASHRTLYLRVLLPTRTPSQAASRVPLVPRQRAQVPSASPRNLERSRTLLDRRRQAVLPLAKPRCLERNRIPSLPEPAHLRVLPPQPAHLRASQLLLSRVVVPLASLRLWVRIPIPLVLRPRVHLVPRHNLRTLSLLAHLRKTRTRVHSVLRRKPRMRVLSEPLRRTRAQLRLERRPNPRIRILLVLPRNPMRHKQTLLDNHRSQAPLATPPVLRIRSLP